jgi:serine/threonine protein phosphatase 1
VIYAVGDIHGELAMLQAMLGLIEHDAATCEGDHEIVFLGDYIDRGPDSKGVVALLKDGPLPFPATCLMGNHEDMCLGDNLPLWLGNGGRKTLESYGGQIDPGHAEWMAARPISHRIGQWLFVHAGIDPDKSLADQDRETMLWIRGRFQIHRGDYESGTVIVHGHTPNLDGPEIMANRINVDTGACYGGALSCAVLSAASLERILEVRAC